MAPSVSYAQWPNVLEAKAIAEEGFIYGLRIVMNYAVMHEYAVDRNSGAVRQGRMSKLRVTAGPLICAALCLSTTIAQAGPCSEDIAQFEAAMRRSAGNPDAGLTAPQSVGAQLDRQPTPDSLKQTKERLQSRFLATMARAKRLDAEGDRAGCTRALSAAKRMYIL